MIRGVTTSIDVTGRFVAFESFAQLDPGDPEFENYDVYVRDRFTGTTHWASRGLSGEPPDVEGGACGERRSRGRSRKKMRAFARGLEAGAGRESGRRGPACACSC